MSPTAVDGKVGVEGEIHLYNNFWRRLEKIAKDLLLDTLEEREGLGWRHIKDYKLDTARTDEKISGFPEEGDCILVLSIDGSAEIKLNRPTADAFDLETYEKIRHPFEDLYLTNTAQAGKTLKLLIGKGDWTFVKAITEIDLSGTIRNDYLEQITDPLKIAQIIKNSHIIPHADIACEKVLVSGTTRLDQWRSQDDYTYMDPGRILLHSTTKLSDWRHPSDLTLINGGQLFAHSVEADKLLIVRHILSGATWADDDPAAGSVAWSGAKVTYNGSTYTITDGNTDKKYIWWDFSLSKTTFQASDTQPTLTDDDFIVAYNDGGTHILIWNATLVDGRNIKTGSISADKYLELRNTIVFMDHDSLDGSYPFELPFEIVSEMTAIQNVKLSFDITNFRAYATGVPSGGGHTTPSGGGHTTPSGGGHTTPAGGGATTATDGQHTTPSGGGKTSSSETHDHAGSTAEESGPGNHQHRIDFLGEASLDYQIGFKGGNLAYLCSGCGTVYYTTAATSAWGSHSHSLNISANGAHQHYSPDHTHTVSAHCHTTYDHTHTVSAHQHAVSAHTHTVSNHTHTLSFGIYEDPQSPTINVYIDNGAGYGASIGAYTTDQLDIDITAHISGAGHKRVKFTSDKRTKVHAWIMTKVDLTA